MKIKLRNNFAFSLIMTFVLIIMFGSCGKKAAPPQISDIKLDATRLRVGKANVVYVDIISNPSSLSLKFDWSTSNGTISTGSTKVTYTPGREGESSISLKVVNSKNDRILITKEFPLTIAPSVSQVDVITNFVFAGFMGDGERFGARAIALDDQYTENPYSLPTCVQIKCRNLPG